MGKPQNEEQDLDEAKDTSRHADSNDPSHHAPGGGITENQDARRKTESHPAAKSEPPINREPVPRCQYRWGRHTFSLDTTSPRRPVPV